jgi:hypothetical protein
LTLEDRIGPRIDEVRPERDRGHKGSDRNYQSRYSDLLDS